MSLPLDILVTIAQHLQLDTLLYFGASCTYAHQVAMQLMELGDQFSEGLHPWIKDACRLVETWIHADSHVLLSAMVPNYNKSSSNLQAISRCIRILAALKPRILVDGHSRIMRGEFTKPLAFVLESKGPWFVEYAITSSESEGIGTPTVGLVDADVSLNTVHTGEWPRDLSCSQARMCQDNRCFAISFSPGLAFSRAVLVEGNSPVLLDGDDGAIGGPVHFLRHSSVFTANLNWEILIDESQTWNAPIQAGFFLENGCLSFWRKVGEEWHSTGVICQALPPKVLPCTFLSSFMGYACVQFEGVRNSPPKCCPQRDSIGCGCDAMAHGIVEGWQAGGPWHWQD